MKLLLLHGAGLGRWIWDNVIPELSTPAEALDLPGRAEGETPGTVTLERAVRSLTASIAGADARCVVVGHSFSATVALAAAGAIPAKVAAVILVGGVFPEPGKAFVSVFPFPQRLVLSLLLKRARGGIELPRAAVRREYCNDLDAARTALVWSRIVPEAPRLYLDPADWSAVPENLPRFYVKLTNDKSVSVRQQDEMIRRAGAAKVETLHTGHLPMLANPSALAAALDRLVSSVE